MLPLLLLPLLPCMHATVMLMLKCLLLPPSLSLLHHSGTLFTMARLINENVPGGWRPVSPHNIIIIISSPCS